MKFLFLLIIPIALFSQQACNNPRKKSKEKTAKAKDVFDIYYDHAQSLLNKQTDSAFYYFTKVATGSKDSILAYTAYNYMGRIQYDAGDYFGSQESYLQSLELLNKQDKQQNERFASSYNGLGRNSRNLKNFDNAINYFIKSIQLSKDSTSNLIRLNNLATTLADQKYYDSAIHIFSEVVKESKTRIEYARALSNLAYTQWLRDKQYPAAPDLLSALQIRETEKDKVGLNASYGHLTDYYLKSKPDYAMLYAQKMYNNAVNIGNPDDQLWALQKLVLLSTGKSSKDYFSRYLQLNDSLQTNRNNAKNQFALIRYETEKQKADNLVLQKENAETKLRVIWQRVFSVVLTVLAIIGFIWYRKRKQQAMRQQELRTSQKVHDVVANGLYTIINKIEHEQELEKEQLLDEMEVLYEQSRNISYNRDETTNKYSEDVIPELLKSFSTPETRVLIVGYSPALWSHISSLAWNETRYALQNLMINMKKHSRAKNVAVRFEQVNDQLKIQYSDDGIGVPPNFRYGHGLKSTETRINRMGGQLIFDLSAPQGVKIKILIPIERAL